MKELSTLQFEPTWEAELGRSFRSADDLAAAGFISPPEIGRYREVLARYKFLLPRYYAGLIDKADPLCPIRLQAIPSFAELKHDHRLSPDPLKDLEHQPSPRVTHRYPNRVLVHLTPNCSMYCRYCFRKSLLNELSGELFAPGLREAIEYVGAHPEIEEVIFSGGDPFLVRDATLTSFIDELSAMSHLQRIRFHTRVPVTFPMRVTDGLARALTKTRFRPVVVMHFNHPRELTEAAREAAAKLGAAGMALLNQSVLLTGVNDSAATLAALSRGLFTAGILPYYLHHPDRAAGTGHFDLTMERGLELHRELKASLPGYLVPKYVVDIVGRPYKSDVR